MDFYVSAIARDISILQHLVNLVVMMRMMRMKMIMNQMKFLKMTGKR
jgi:hypothetical protein